MAKNSYDTVYLPTFIEELNEIIYYITYILKNKRAAEKLLIKIEKAILDRKKNPIGFEKFKNIHSKNLEWYRIYVGNYIIFYTLNNNHMIVSRILYRRRNFNQLL